VPGPVAAFPELAKLLDRFEEAWQSGIPALADFLPAEASHRRQTLVELVKIDMNHRWRHADATGPLGKKSKTDADLPQRPRLADYLWHFPDLGPADALPADLIAEEYWIRHCWGDRPGHEEYLRAYPQQAAALGAALSRMDGELARQPSQSASLTSVSAVPLAVAVAPITSVSSFLDALRDLRLLSSTQLNDLGREDLQARFAQPRDLATWLQQRHWLSDYQAEKVLQGRGADLLLGAYVLLEPLGGGGGGQVFKARHERMNRLAAVKVIRPELLADPDMVRRFYREVEAVSQLQNAHIVHAYDAGPAGPTHFLAMEFLDAIDLSRHVKQSGPLPIEEAREYIRQAAVGLQYIHEQGMVHRDIKPSNLMLCERVGEWKSESALGLERSHSPSLSHSHIRILDLGLARLHQRATGETATAITGSNTTIMGTVDYMAPEQALDSHAVDIRADIYSLGCTLFYLLTGQPPFPGGTEAERLVRHQLKQSPDVREMRPEVPEELAAIVRKMLAKESGERFGTPAEVVQALSGESPVFSATARCTALSSSRTLPLGMALRKAPPHRRRWLLGAVGAIVALGVGSIAYLGQPSPQTTRQLHSVKEGPLLFQDNFADGNLKSDWRCSRPDLWRVVPAPDGPGFVLDGGTLAAPAIPSATLDRYQSALTCGEQNWSDYAVEVSVRFGKPPELRTDHYGILLLARMRDPKNNCWLEYVFAQGKGQPILELNQVVGGEYTKKTAEGPIPHFQPDKWYRLRLEVQGSLLRGFIDDAKLVERATSLKAGKAGLSRPDANNSQGRILWRNVRVTPLPS
jgi:serine/threonine-protein kinase